MSLYNLAEDLFADIDRVRVAAPKPRSDARTHMRSTDNDQENIRIVNEVKLPLLRFSPRDGDTPQTPTLELLEGCLRDIHKIRCGSRLASVAETKHRRFKESIGDITGFVGDQDRVPSSSSETPCTAGELSGQKIFATAGSDITGCGTGMSVPTIVELGDRQTHETQFEGKIVPSSLGSSSGGYATKAGALAMSTSTSAGESRASRASLNHPCPRLLQNGECLAKGRVEAVRSDIDVDTVAKESFAEFEREIADWSVSAGANVSHHVRMNTAAHLSAKYLWGVLDPMPSSALVCRLRREVSRLIDQLATGEGLSIEEPRKGVLCGVGERAPPCEHRSDVKGNDCRHEGLRHRSRDHVTSSLVKARAIVGLVGPGTLSLRHGRLTGSLGAVKEGGGPARYEGELEDVGRTLPDMAGKSISGDSKTIISSTSRTNSSRSSRSSSRDSLCNSPAVADNPSGSQRCIATTATGYVEGNTGVPQIFVDQVVQSTPVRENKAGSSSSSRRAEGSQARVVRFLLNEDSGKDQPVPTGGVGGSRTQAKNAEPEAPKPVDVDSLWICFVCDRRNDPGRAVCAICGRRRQDHGRVATQYSNKRVEQHSSGADWRHGGSKGRPARRREEAHQESVGEAVGSGGETLVVRGSGPGGLVATVAQRSNRGVGRYDVSSFAKMKEMTEPAVKARLSLTGEIKSLLSALRGGS